MRAYGTQSMSLCLSFLRSLIAQSTFQDQRHIMTFLSSRVPLLSRETTLTLHIHGEDNDCDSQLPQVQHHCFYSLMLKAHTHAQITTLSKLSSPPVHAAFMFALLVPPSLHSTICNLITIVLFVTKAGVWASHLQRVSLPPLASCALLLPLALWFSIIHPLVFLHSVLWGSKAICLQIRYSFSRPRILWNFVS